MGRSLVKLRDPRDGREYLFEWSSVVDAPVAVFQDDVHAAAYCRDEYGRLWFERYWEGYWARLEATGTTARGYPSGEALIAVNRAGEHEACLTVEQLIDAYGKEADDERDPDPVGPEEGPGGDLGGAAGRRRHQ